MLLLIHCFLSFFSFFFLGGGGGVFDSCFVIQYLLFSLIFCNHLDEDERASCFALILYLLLCG